MSSTIALILIGVAVLFILGIKFLSSPKTARIGNLVAAAGMTIGLVILCKPTGENIWFHGGNYLLITIGILVGLAIGALGAYSVKMTAMPQMVALFNGLGGGAAALVASLEFLKHAQPLLEAAGIEITMPQNPTAAVTIPMLFATLIGS
ncbi:MAG TPA: NAD(P)(+) transhydrogenase (Re/Si-specific) subunit beta, partial [Verrucomicrobiae bacterium]|nr:NAD(P)(+) transhydrogenase (Re/Si-specific) subunit beta [Verrucomicrobiae bacterium]